MDCSCCGLGYTPKHKRHKYCSKRCCVRMFTAYNRYRRKSKRLAGKQKPFWRERKLKSQTWLDLAKFWCHAPEGMVVDHIIPIVHPNVSGLNCLANLQYLSKRDNEKKANSFDGTYENKGWLDE